jgi:hypothetical protein
LISARKRGRMLVSHVSMLRRVAEGDGRGRAGVAGRRVGRSCKCWQAQSSPLQARFWSSGPSSQRRWPETPTRTWALPFALNSAGGSSSPVVLPSLPLACSSCNYPCPCHRVSRRHPLQPTSSPPPESAGNSIATKRISSQSDEFYCIRPDFIAFDHCIAKPVVVAIAVGCWVVDSTQGVDGEWATDPSRVPHFGR